MTLHPSLDGAAVETPSGKGAADENFPVGSLLIARGLRPHVMRFYAFARAADDIADNPALSRSEKIARLDAFEASLTLEGPLDKPRRLAESCRATGVTDRHGRDLLAAFRQDAIKRRYHDFDELLAYCELSANPVGRFLLDLHGEDPAGYPVSDALCTVLQILNHLQDVKPDYERLDRVYLPLEWMEAEGIGVDSLGQAHTSQALRRVLDRTLAACDELIRTACALPAALADRRLAAESETIVRLARRLGVRLGRGDPLAERVALTRADFAAAAAGGLAVMLVHRRRATGRPA